MRAVIALAITLAAAACSPAPDQRDENRSAVPAGNAPATDEASGPESLPTRQPDGSPLTEGYCMQAGDEPGSPFGNTKTCRMLACDTGDKASCKMAETYNGNLWPDGVPEENEAVPNGS